MRAVYRAKDPRQRREITIKVLPTHFGGNADPRQRFEREAKAISSLNYPGIGTLCAVVPRDRRGRSPQFSSSRSKKL